MAANTAVLELCRVKVCSLLFTFPANHEATHTLSKGYAYRCYARASQRVRRDRNAKNSRTSRALARGLKERGRHDPGRKLEGRSSMQVLLQLIVSGIARRHDLRRHRVRLPAHVRDLGDAEFRPGRGADAGRAGRPHASVDPLGHIGLLADDPARAGLRVAAGRRRRTLGVRPAIRIKSESGWIMATIALGIIFKNVAENIWGRDDLHFPSPLPETADQVGGVQRAADGDR